MKQILVSLLVLLLVATTVSADGLGISPATVDFKQVLRGQEYTKEISVQSISSSPTTVTLGIDSYVNWFTLQDSVYLPAGQPAIEKVFIKLKVPRRTELGLYETTALATSLCGDWICTAVQFNIKFEVTNEKIYDGRIDYILTRDVYLNEDLNINVMYSNYGNIKNRVIVKTELTKSGETIDKFRRRFRVNPYSSEKLTATYDGSELSTGLYYANVKVYLKTARRQYTMLEEKSIHFNVVDYEYPYWSK